DGDGFGADDYADVAQGEGGREICRVLRPGRRCAAGCGSRHDCKHGAGVWGDDGLFSDLCGVGELSARDRAERGALQAVRELLSRTGTVWNSEERGNCLLDGFGTGPGCGAAERGRAEASTGPDRIAEAEE